MEEQSQYSKVDEYGFERPENFNYAEHDRFMSRYLRILTRRALRWTKLNNFKKTGQLKRFCRKGIPSEHRLSTWMAMSGGLDLQQTSDKPYSVLRQSLPSEYILETIKIDLPRTFPDNIYFHNLEPQLFNVLSTFAQSNHQVGYCQGLNYIAGLLLLATQNEEGSYWLLKALIEQILPQYYIVSMEGLLVDLDVLDDLIKVQEPQIWSKVHSVGMPWAMATTKWFICLYAEVLPTETVLRIWDCLFFEGSKILFRVALTLLKLHKVNLLQCNELSDMMSCFKDFKNHKDVIDCHQFMQLVFTLPGNLSNKTIEALRRKHQR